MQGATVAVRALRSADGFQAVRTAATDKRGTTERTATATTKRTKAKREKDGNKGNVPTCRRKRRQTAAQQKPSSQRGVCGTPASIRRVFTRLKSTADEWDNNTSVIAAAVSSQRRRPAQRSPQRVPRSAGVDPLRRPQGAHAQGESEAKAQKGGESGGNSNRKYEKSASRASACPSPALSAVEPGRVINIDGPQARTGDCGRAHKEKKKKENKQERDRKGVQPQPTPPPARLTACLQGTPTLALQSL